MVRDQLKINMFGRITVQQGNRRISRFRTEKTGLLLACLAQDPHRRYRREELIERLWPEHEPEAGRNCLRIALNSLRQQLEAEGGEKGSLLIADRQEVHLQPGSYTTDKAEFEENLLKATQARDDAARIKYLQAAVEQYQADLLPDCGDIWIMAERQRLSDAYIMALRRLVKLHVSAREYDRALAMAQKAVRADPQREESHRLLMQVLALIGRPAAALRQYRELETVLNSTLGITPSQPTQTVLNQVYERVGVQIPSSSSQPLPSPRVPDLESAAPRRPVARLPVPLTRLFGRDDEILQVLEMLSTPETRLVSLLGMGGVGKTRLALAVAEQIQTGAKQSVCFISLAGLTRSEPLLTTLALSLQLPLRPRHDLWKRVVEALSAEPTLLVLDNLEHLLPEAGAVVRSLLEATQTLTCLVTSRQRLNIPGEYAFTVKPLPLAPEVDDPDQIKDLPGIRLWLDRAQSVCASFQLTSANVKDVAALNRRLDGIPLAIELAAAWAGMLTPAQIVSRLNARFDLLVSRQPGIEGRHASLGAAMEWSYHLLSPAVQRFFGRLGHFRGGWTIEAAEAVCEEPLALEYLAQLCERSLISAEETGSGMRYYFLETVRDYAVRCLTGTDHERVLRQFSAYFTQLLQSAEAGMKGPLQTEWMQRLKDDEDNIRAVLKQTTEDGGSPEHALRLTVALFRYWYTRGDSQEGRSWLTAALEHAPPTAPDRSNALMALGNLAYSEGDFPGAEDYFSRCQILRSSAGDKRGLANTLGSLGNVVHKKGDLPRARALLLQSLRLFQVLADPRGQARTHGNLASLMLDAGEDCAALSHALEALDRFRELGDQHDVMLALNNAGSSLLRVGDVAQARKYLDESLSLCLQLRSPRDLARVLAGAATAAHRTGQEGAAMKLLGASARLRDNAQVCLSAQSRQEIESEQQALTELLGEQESSHLWACGYNLCEEGMTALARGILRSQKT